MPPLIVSRTKVLISLQIYISVAPFYLKFLKQSIS